MCQEGSLPSIPERICGISYAIYCIVVGSVFVLICVMRTLSFQEDEEQILLIANCIAIILAISYIVAGILLLLGIKVSK